MPDNTCIDNITEALEMDNWSKTLTDLDEARRRARRAEFSFAARLDVIDAEIAERIAFKAHLEEIFRDAQPGSSVAAGLRDA